MTQEIVPHLDILIKHMVDILLIYIKDRSSKVTCDVSKGSVSLMFKKALKIKIKPNYIIFQSYRDNKPIYL